MGATPRPAVGPKTAASTEPHLHYDFPVYIYLRKSLIDKLGTGRY
jgi:hypothetical protein